MALVAVVFLVYQPAWRGNFIWDDDLHLVNNPVLKPGGLISTWVPGSYVNYWPLTFTAYRLEYALWGLARLGYHLVNIGLHGISAILVWRILRLLRIPGGLLAAALFALHPVNVESVAWITQLKNTLSLTLTLLSVLLYLLDEQRGEQWAVGSGQCGPPPPSARRQSPLLYVAAVALFALATLAKGMTLTLPVVLLACAWWQYGRIQRRDLWRVVPFLAIGLAMVAMEVVQQRAVAQEMVVRSDGLLSRTAVAGCAVWFYLWKLVWPVNLAFVYPRWDLAAVSVWWFVPGLALAAILAAAWWWRHSWGRPVLMLIVCYVALLLPVLGFVNIYFMEFSLVADHWQYAATIVPCAAAAGAAAAGWQAVRCVKRTKAARYAVGACHAPDGAGGAFYAPCVAVLSLALLATLGMLTRRQSAMYADAEKLYRETIDRNPRCWMAENNLGAALVQRGDIEGGIGHYQKALELNSGCTEARNNLGAAFVRRGQVDEAIRQYREVLRVRPKYPEARNNLGAALLRQERTDEAIEQFQQALQRKPDYTEARNNLGFALAQQGRTDEAIEHYRKALLSQPDYAEAHYNLGRALASAAGPRRRSSITGKRCKPSRTTPRSTIGSASPWPSLAGATRPSGSTRRP